MDQFLGGFAVLGVLIIALPLGLIILGLAIVFNGRREPDPEGVRTTAVYFSLIDFTALVVVIFAATSIMGSLSSFIVPEEDRQSTSSFDAATDISGLEGDTSFLEEDDGFGSTDPNDQAIRDIIQGGLIVIPALLVFIFHWRRRETFVAEPGFDESPGFRVDRIYLYSICFLAALLGAIAVGRVIYDVFRLIIPGITSDLGDNSLERKMALSDMLTMLTLGGISIYLFFWNWGLVSGETEPWTKLRSNRTPPPPGGIPAAPAPAGGAAPPPPSGPGLSAPPSTPPPTGGG